MAKKRTGGRTAAIAFLVLSAFAGLFGVVVVYLFLTNMKDTLIQMERGQERVDVVVANNVIHPGDDIQEEHLSIKSIPREYLPDTVYHTINDVVGRTSRERILTGEAIRQERLAQPAAGKGLNAIIPHGQRSVQLQLGMTDTVAGFINPGNFVDVLATGNDSDGVGRTETILQSVKVLAIGTRLKEDMEQGKRGQRSPRVTLSLTPTDAMKLVQARAVARLKLTLRNDIDVSKKDLEGIKKGELVRQIGSKRHRVALKDIPRPKTSQPAPSRTIRTHRGSDSQDVKVGK